MKHVFSTLAIAASFVFAGAAGAQTDRDAGKAQKDRIEADYKAGKERCKQLKDNAKDICEAEVKGRQNIAKAELEAQQKPGPANEAKLRTVRAEAAYEVAKEKCDDMNDKNAKSACEKDARATMVSAKADAKAAKTTADARADAKDDKADAQYAAARAKCDAMSGNGKDACLADAKKRYGKM
jgi:hypothetical protein